MKIKAIVQYFLAVERQASRRPCCQRHAF